MDGITNISANSPVYFKAFSTEGTRQHVGTQDVSTPKATEVPVPPQESILDIHRELAAIAPALNQRLEFSFHKELGQVVVKIIDRQTDTVIKELPPTEFQRVHIALREAIGLLIDKKV
jgi:flagellar protein FlaG